MRKNDSGQPDPEAVLARLKKLGSQKVRDGMARFAIPSTNAFGIPVGILRQEGKRLGRSPALASALWESGWYEARMLAVFVDDPAAVTSAQMDRWCRDFDNWAICDTACFHLFDRSPHAWKKVRPWAKLSGEFQKRAAFALLWSLAVHDRKADDALFREHMKLIERESGDARNFVKKAVNMALRAIGKRRSGLRADCVALAQRLADADDATARWNGRDALRELRMKR